MECKIRRKLGLMVSSQNNELTKNRRTVSQVGLLFKVSRGFVSSSCSL